MKFPFTTRRKYDRLHDLYLKAMQTAADERNARQDLSAKLCEVQRRIVALLYFAGTREKFNDELLQLMIFINKE